MIEVLLPLGLVVLLLLLDRTKLDRPSQEGEAMEKTVVDPGLRFRSRVSWCDAVPDYQGYGAAAVAVVNCKSGATQNRKSFVSPRRSSCQDLQLQYGGERECAWACLGEADCVRSCNENAMTMEKGLPKIDSTRCTGCGDCITACPRQVLSLVPAAAQVHVNCASDDPQQLRQDSCDLGCANSRRCLENSFVSEEELGTCGERRIVNYTRSSNLVPLVGLCPTGLFSDRIPHRPNFTITDLCTGCGDCLQSCPVENCLTDDGESAEKGPRARINSRSCVGCGLCVPHCEIQAIRVVGAIGYDLQEQL